jgi:UDP-glucose:(heptosyl)LPS alpha-1,3-glucosyltransferase
MRDRIVTVPNGVDTSEFRPDPVARDVKRGELGLDPDELVALFVGGDWPRKGLAVAIEAIVRAPAWRLMVVGQGDVDAYRRRARDLGVGDRIVFLPPTPDIASYYQAADAFLLPTSYETFSLVTYEAAASGLPLLVTRVSGVEDLLRDGEDGWLITRDPAAIAQCLDRLADDPGLRLAMGAAARSRSQEFDWGSVLEAYGRLYRGLTPRSGLGAGVTTAR